MAGKGLKPVSVAGIEFDALIDETKTMSSTIPAYPVEDGFPVSDTIIPDPVKVQMTLYVSGTPVTWLYRHGSSRDRVNRICERIEDLWLGRELVKVVTTDTIYKSMGITNITIKNPGKPDMPVRSPFSAEGADYEGADGHHPLLCAQKRGDHGECRRRPCRLLPESPVPQKRLEAPEHPVHLETWRKG